LHFDLAVKSEHRLNMIEKNHLPDVFSQHPQVMSGALVFKGTRVPVRIETTVLFAISAARVSGSLGGSECL